MKPDTLQKILHVLYLVKEDKPKLKKIFRFLEDEIVPDIKVPVIVIPKQYEALVRGLAQDLEGGFTCYLNMDTLETEVCHPDYSSEDWGDITGEPVESRHLEWENVLSIKPFTSEQRFDIMEAFAQQLAKGKEQNIILDILDRAKPFANFNRFIHQSRLREDWLQFRNKWYENDVRTSIYNELERAKPRK